MAIVLLFPFIVIGVVAVVAVVFTRFSYLRISTAGVEFRNYPQPPKLVPLAEVAHFEATPPVGNFSTLRPSTAVLVLTDGSRLPVRRITAADAGSGVDALNARINALRRT